MRILITGSRDWTREHTIKSALHDLRQTYPGRHTIVSGACPTGADAMCEAVALAEHLFIERHPADWKKWGKAAGFMRNQDMVDLGADRCYAFVKVCTKCPTEGRRVHGSHGAMNTVVLAQKAGIETRIWKDGW